MEKNEKIQIKLTTDNRIRYTVPQKITDINDMYDTREERDAKFENLCPCIHEYAWRKD